jgi:hypothetical protein
MIVFLFCGYKARMGGGVHVYTKVGKTDTILLSGFDLGVFETKKCISVGRKGINAGRGFAGALCHQK